MTYINTDIEFEIDASEIVSDAHGDIYSIAEEAVAEYDISDKVQEEVETSVENVFDGKLQEYLLENPATLLKAMYNAFDFATDQRQLVIDQAREMQELREKLVESSKQLEEATAPTSKINETPADL